MIEQAINAIIDALESAGIRATADNRNIFAPCCFVTVTKVSRPTLGVDWQIEGEILAIARDLGGAADIEQISALVDNVLDAVESEHIAIHTIETNQQATPPTGGTLPAARLSFSIYSDRS